MIKRSMDWLLSAIIGAQLSPLPETPLKHHRLHYGIEGLKAKGGINLAPIMPTAEVSFYPLRT